jgi:hypothetical protein
MNNIIKYFSYLLFCLLLSSTLGCLPQIGYFESPNITSVLYNREDLDIVHARSAIESLSNGYAESLGYNHTVQLVLFSNQSSSFQGIVIDGVDIPMLEAVAIFDSHNSIIYRYTGAYINHIDEYNYTFEDTTSTGSELGESVCFFDNNCNLVEGVSKELLCKTKIDMIDSFNTANPSVFSKEFTSDPVVRYKIVQDNILNSLFTCSCQNEDFTDTYDFTVKVNGLEQDWEQRRQKCDEMLQHDYRIPLDEDIKDNFGPSISSDETDYTCRYYITFGQKKCKVINHFSAEEDAQGYLILNSTIDIPSLKICNTLVPLVSGENRITIPSECRNSCIEISYNGFSIGKVNCYYRR